MSLLVTPAHAPHRPLRRVGGRRCRALLALLLVACAGRDPSAAGPAAGRVTPYVARRRDLTITTVPLLVKEQQGVLPFLKADFAKSGVLAGKEVYAFSPSSVTVVEGDTIHFTLINPEDDVHSFVLPDLAVPLPPQRMTTATYVARRAGVYPFVCAVPAHLPMMAGQLVVLSAAAVAGGAAPSGGASATGRPPGPNAAERAIHSAALRRAAAP